MKDYRHTNDRVGARTLASDDAGTVPPGKQTLVEAEQRHVDANTVLQRRTDNRIFGALADEQRPVQARGALDGPEVHAAAARGTAGNGSRLPHLDAIQRSFGHHDVGGVRAHVGGASAEAARSMGATAYASGDDVAFAESPDLHLAAHEAAHVVQQRGGVRLAGGVGRAGDEYERHADAVADLVVQGKSAQGLLDQYAHRGPTGGPAVQRNGPGDEPPRQPPTQPATPQQGLENWSDVDANQHEDEYRRRVTVLSRSEGVPFPTEAMNNMDAFLEGLASNPRRATQEFNEIVTATLTWRWRLRAHVTISSPRARDMQAQTGTRRSTVTNNTTGRTGRESETTRGSTTRDEVGGRLGYEHAGNESGPAASATGEREDTRTESQRNENTAAAGSSATTASAGDVHGLTMSAMREVRLSLYAELEHVRASTTDVTETALAAVLPTAAVGPIGGLVTGALVDPNAAFGPMADLVGNDGGQIQPMLDLPCGRFVTEQTRSIAPPAR